MNRYRLEYAIEFDENPTNVSAPWDVYYYMVDVLTNEAVTTKRRIESFKTQEEAIYYLAEISDPNK